eukprot:1433140-Pleurochrysis_carterae.AAC.1
MTVRRRGIVPRRRAREHLEQHAAKRPDIRLAAAPEALDVLRRPTRTAREEIKRALVRARTITSEHTRTSRPGRSYVKRHAHACRH